jgi:phage terminase large subunit-like protein
LNNKKIAIQYAKDIIRSKLPANELTILACKRFLYDLVNPHYYYCPKDVDSRIKFMNCLKLIGDDWGKDFILMSWQTFFICGIYGIKRKSDGYKKTNSVFLNVPRKNGKSLLVCALAFYEMLFQQDGQVILAANSLRQIKEVDHDILTKLILQIDPSKKHIKINYSAIKYNNNVINFVVATPATLDGLNASLAIIDEYHEAVTSRVSDVIASSQSNRKDPTFIIITTSGYNVESPCYQLHSYCKDILCSVIDDPSQFALMYGVDDQDIELNDPKDYETILRKANPNYGISANPTTLLNKLKRSKIFDNERPEFLVKNLNYWLQTSTDKGWIDDKYIVNSMKNINITDKMFEGRDVWIGADLAKNRDLSSITYMFVIDNDFYFFNKYYIPSDNVSSQANREFYQKAALQGHINIQIDSNITDYDLILNDILEVGRKHDIRLLAYDSFNASQFIINATEMGINCLPFCQLNGSMTKPISNFERLMLSDRVILQKNIITKWCFGNVEIITDKYGNQNVDKKKRNKKIDGVSSILTSLGGCMQSEAGIKYINIYN